MEQKKTNEDRDGAVLQLGKDKKHAAIQGSAGNAL